MFSESGRSFGSCGSFGSGGSVRLGESALWVQREFQLEVRTLIIPIVYLHLEKALINLL